MNAQKVAQSHQMISSTDLHIYRFFFIRIRKYNVFLIDEAVVVIQEIDMKETVTDGITRFYYL